MLAGFLVVLVIVKLIGFLTDNVSLFTVRSNGDTETTTRSDESHSTPNDSPQLCSVENDSFLCGDLFSVDSDILTEEKSTTIRLVTDNEWMISMQFRLEMLHSIYNNTWSRKERKRPPKVVFEISVLDCDGISRKAW
jgi:hypothetical protein